MQDVLYFEDLEIGSEYRSDSIKMSQNEIIEYAKKYDPQPFHTDPEAAKRSVFGELVASGWHTAAVTMRLRVTSPMKLAGGWVGMGVEYLKWPKPVRPGDSLYVTVQAIEKRESQTKPDRGVIRVRTSTFNQHHELVFETVSVQLVLRRTALGSH